MIRQHQKPPPQVHCINCLEPAPEITHGLNPIVDIVYSTIKHLLGITHSNYIKGVIKGPGSRGGFPDCLVLMWK